MPKHGVQINTSSYIWEYGDFVRIERKYIAERSKDGSFIRDANGNPVYLWKAYQRVRVNNWNPDTGRGKHPVTGLDTTLEETLLIIGEGTEEEMDELAIARQRQLETTH